MQHDPTADASVDALPRSDARRLVKTATPGIYKRGDSYVVVYRAAGKQRKEFARTLEQARKIKRAREADRDRGEFQPRSKLAFREFLTEWIDRYHGTGRRGFHENTRDEYRRLLDQYAHRYFGERLRLGDVTPHHLAQFVGWLADGSTHGKRLSDSTVANAVVPLRAALATAQREGLIRHNPSAGLALPVRERIEEDEQEEVKALNRDQLAAFLSMVPARYSLLFELIGSTGLRVSEATALQRKHLHLDGSRPHLRVRRAIVKQRVEPTKTRHGKRSVPLAPSTVLKLRAHLVGWGDANPDALVFQSMRGTALDPDNIRARVVKPLAQEIGAPWMGFHTLRHTYASLQLASGANVLQLSRALGHHSPAFTLNVYCHLLPGDEVSALDLGDVLPSPEVVVAV
jgi:integrase